MASNLHCLGYRVCSGKRSKVIQLSNVKYKSRLSTIEREDGVYATILTKKFKQGIA